MAPAVVGAARAPTCRPTSADRSCVARRAPARAARRGARAAPRNRNQHRRRRNQVRRTARVDARGRNARAGDSRPGDRRRGRSACWKRASACCRCRPRPTTQLNSKRAAEAAVTRRESELRRLDHRHAHHGAGRDAERQQHMRAGDRRQPHFEVLVVGHELGRRAIAAMAGDRHVANGADGDRALVALGGNVALADVGQIDVEARIAVEHRNLAIARGGADQRTLGGDRHDDGADRVDDALLVAFGQRHAIGLVVEWRRDVDPGHRVGGQATCGSCAS